MKADTSHGAAADSVHTAYESSSKTVRPRPPAESLNTATGAARAAAALAASASDAQRSIFLLLLVCPSEAREQKETTARAPPRTNDEARDAAFTRVAEQSYAAHGAL